MKRQTSLLDAWPSPSPKAAKADETHSSLKRLLPSRSWEEFKESVAKQRAEEADELVQRALRRNRRKNVAPGEVKDPSLNGRGVSTNCQMGRPSNSVYKKLGIKNHRRELGGPVLRRDKTAHEKMAVLINVDGMCTAKRKDKKGEGDWSTLSIEDKRAVVTRFQLSFESVSRWNKQRAKLQEFVAKHRIGKHGLLPCGSRGKTLTGTRSTGKRMADPTKLAKRPLHGVFTRLKAWLSNERQFNHEVRKSHVVERFLYEAEYERDKQLVLQQHGSPEFKPQALEKVRTVLATYQIVSPSEKQDRWFKKVVLPNIGGRVRGAQRLSAKPIALDEVKARLSWATSDWFQNLVMRGSPEQLSEFVARPSEFCEHRARTSFVVMDQVAMWLKVRGEEKLIYSSDETMKAAKRKRHSRAFKNATNDADRAQAAAAAAEQAEADPEFKGQSTSSYTSGGDKHRVTLVNISGVRGWFDAGETPKPEKSKLVLLVTSSEHCKLSDIDSEGNWKRDWQLESTDGEIKQFEKGTSALGKLKHWRVARDRILELDPGHEFEFEVWGQPKAWTDEIVASWIVEFIAEQYGQCLCLTDCLAAQWTEPVLLRAWLNQVIWMPLAPDTTSFLAEPDTHEHAQMKASIRKVKAEVHRAYEAAWHSQRREGCRDSYVPMWGPFELYTVLEKGLKSFKESNPRVPLEGLIKNQFLAIRPTSDGRLAKIDESAEWAAPILPPTRGIPSRQALERLRDVELWLGNTPPRPDWEQLDNVSFQLREVANEMPPEEAENQLEFEFEKLSLTEHQKLMLLPPSRRIRQIEYPEAVRKRTAVKKAWKRKNQWSAKFSELFVGKGRKKWAVALEKHGKNNAAWVLKLEPRRKPKEKTRKPNATEVDEAVEKKYGKAVSAILTRKRWRKAAKTKAAKAKKKKGEPVENSEWIGKVVRVTADIPEEHTETGPAPASCSPILTAAGNVRQLWALVCNILQNSARLGNHQQSVLAALPQALTADDCRVLRNFAKYCKPMPKIAKHCQPP